MDPNSKPPVGQPSWAEPQPPGAQPGWAAPQPPSEQPPAWNQGLPPAQQPPGWAEPQSPAPQPGWDAPQPGQPQGWGTPPPGQPGWGYPPVAPPKSHKTRNILLGVAGLVVVLIVIAGVFVVLNNPAGKVMFSTSVYDTSRSTCTFVSPITTATTTDSIYIIAALNDTLTPGQTVTMEVFKDGASQGTQDFTEPSELNCLWIKNDLGPLTPGVWKIVMTYNGKVEAEGTITVK